MPPSPGTTILNGKYVSFLDSLLELRFSLDKISALNIRKHINLPFRIVLTGDDGFGPSVRTLSFTLFYGAATLLLMNLPTPPLITRRDAFTQGAIRYYTGKPCKQGHLAQRYVSTGSCVECQNPFRTRRHPYRKDLQPYVCAKLWVPTSATPEQFTQLASYLQTCIDHFFAPRTPSPGDTQK